MFNELQGQDLPRSDLRIPQAGSGQNTQPPTPDSMRGVALVNLSGVEVCLARARRVQDALVGPSPQEEPTKLSNERSTYSLGELMHMMRIRIESLENTLANLENMVGTQ